MMKTAVLSLLLTFQPYHADTETKQARRDRLEIVTDASIEASRGDVEVLAFLLMTGGAETRWAQHAHEGRCREGECDGGKAATPWQVWRLRSMSDEQWRAMIGADRDSTRRAAEYAAGLYRSKRAYCGSALGAINAYATGKCSGWAGAPSRLRVMRSIQGRLSGGR